MQMENALHFYFLTKCDEGSDIKEHLLNNWFIFLQVFWNS